MNTIEKTSLEDRRVLKENGFVHITGLMLFKQNGRKEIAGDNLLASQLGRRGLAAGWELIITTGGEIWISAAGIKSAATTVGLGLIAELTPRGFGNEEITRDFANGTQIDILDLLRRLNNPDCEPLVK